MSYCRWSSDDFQCDVYCYQHEHGGIAIHVAGRRPNPARALPPPEKPVTAFGYVKRLGKVTDIIRDSPHEDIGLPFDGEEYILSTPGEAAGKLEELKRVGYNVPEYAIERLKQEERER